MATLEEHVAMVRRSLTDCACDYHSDPRPGLLSLIAVEAEIGRLTTAVAKERERCARIAETSTLQRSNDGNPIEGERSAAQHIAVAIRMAGDG